MDKPRYINVPIMELQNIHKDKRKAINNMLEFGISKFVQSINYNIEDVAKQLHYWICKDKNTGKLYDACFHYNFEVDEDYNGFDGNGQKYDPCEDYIDPIIEALKTDEHLKNLAVKEYQKQSVKNLFNLSYIATTDISKKTPQQPLPSISLPLLFDFRDNKKTEFEVMLFCFYVAIKSIVGKKPFAKTNNAFILARAFGYNVPKDITELPEQYEKYSKRYWIDKLFFELERSWHVFKYSHNMRGYFVGIETDENKLENIIYYIEKSKTDKSKKHIKNRKMDARKKALQQLNKEHQLK